MKGKTRQWLEKAQDDLSLATLAFEHKYFLHMMFMCQQVLEKTIKAVIEEQSEERPPFSHDLIYLAEYAGRLIDLSEKDKRLLALLTQYYIESRYPEEKRDLNKQLTPEACKKTLKMTEEFMSWLISSLK